VRAPYIQCLKTLTKDVISISLGWLIVAQCDHTTHCVFQWSLNIMMICFVSFLCLLFNFLPWMLIFEYHSLSCSCFYSTSIISNSFTFDLWWHLTKEKYRYVLLSWQNTCLLDILNWCDIFLMSLIFL
jgi:hypothetical protein